MSFKMIRTLCILASLILFSVCPPAAVQPSETAAVVEAMSETFGIRLEPRLGGWLTSLETISDRLERKMSGYRGMTVNEALPFLLFFMAALAVSILTLYVLLVKNRRLGRNLKIQVKLRTREIHEKTAMLSAMLSAIPDIVFSKDLDGRYTQCNDSLLRYLGLESKDVLGHTDDEIFGTPENDDYLKFMFQDSEVIGTRAVRVYEDDVYSPSLGYARVFETIKAPLAHGGQVSGVIGISRDVTERKAIEEEVRMASRAKSEFLARISHEIRTPLNAIIGMTQITRSAIEGENLPKALKSVDEITNASKHLLGLLNDVLDMSKIESGKFEIASAPFNFVPAMEEVSSIISLRCREKFINFETNLAELPDISLVGDRLRLNQVLINLLGNAVKFTNKNGRIVFHIDIRDSETGPGWVDVAFTLSDDGIGMTGEQMKRLFNPFEQADSSIASRFGGTGLGLSISQSLVNLMGGMITVESEVDFGSTFRFDLTLLRAEGYRETRDPEAETGELDLSGRRLLLAEDLEINRTILRELLSPTNVEMDEAPDGRTLVEMFAASPAGYYDLIFMDIQMPVMNGYEAAVEIRGMQRDDARDVPIIAMTANAYQEDINRALAVGMNGHISKPINIEIVKRTLAGFLGRTP
jgi:PAS domain S-box-containing protein